MAGCGEGVFVDPGGLAGGEFDFGLFGAVAGSGGVLFAPEEGVVAEGEGLVVGSGDGGAGGAGGSGDGDEVFASGECHSEGEEDGGGEGEDGDLEGGEFDGDDADEEFADASEDVAEAVDGGGCFGEGFDGVEDVDG